MYQLHPMFGTSLVPSFVFFCFFYSSVCIDYNMQKWNSGWNRQDLGALICKQWYRWMCGGNLGLSLIRSSRVWTNGGVYEPGKRVAHACLQLGPTPLHPHHGPKCIDGLRNLVRVIMFSPHAMSACPLCKEEDIPSHVLNTHSRMFYSSNELLSLFSSVTNSDSALFN